MVFQAYSLFPNMTAEQNVEYGLRIRRKPKADRRKRIGELLELVGLGHAGKRYPASALRRDAAARRPRARARDRAERAAAGRAALRARREGARDSCARRSAASSWSSGSRPSTSRTTRRRRCRSPTASRSCTAASIEQVGSPVEMYGSPATPFVAEFIGTMNRLDLDGRGRRLRRVRRTAGCASTPPRACRAASACCCSCGRRRSRSRRRPTARPANGGVTGEVVSHIFLGSVTRVRIEDPDGDRGLTADIPPARADALTIGTRVTASFPPEGARLLSLADQPESYGPDPDSQ